MRCLAAFCKNLKECLEDTRSAEPPEPLPYAVPIAKFVGQCSPGNAVDREIVNCLQESAVVMPRLSPASIAPRRTVKCDPPIPLRHSRKHVRLPDAGHAVIRLISDSGIRQKCMPGIPSTQPRCKESVFKTRPTIPTLQRVRALLPGRWLPEFSLRLPLSVVRSSAEASKVARDDHPQPRCLAKNASVRCCAIS